MGLSGHSPEAIIQLKSLLEFVLHRTRFPCLFCVTVQTIQNQNRFFFFFLRQQKRPPTQHVFRVARQLKAVTCSPDSLQGRCFLPWLMSRHLLVPSSAMLPMSCLFRLTANHSQLTSCILLITNSQLVLNVYVGNLFLGHFSMTQNKCYNLYCLYNSLKIQPHD